MKKNDFTQCHNCQFNGKQNPICIQCAQKIHNDAYKNNRETYLSTKYDGNAIPEKEYPIKTTDLPEEIEDYLKIMLYKIADLEPLELLLLQSIINGNSLIDFANSMTILFERNEKMTRHHAFQLRKSMLKKNPSWKYVLQTVGQKKELKI